MPLHNLSSDELRSICRQRLETLELWLRGLIHDEFSREFGASYFEDGVIDGNLLFRKEIRDLASTMITRNPDQYKSKIDTLTLDYIVSTICKRDIYTRFFKTPLQEAFPEGNEEARTFLSRLVPIRNALSHANPISVRDAEQVVCYSGDVIDSLKKYHKDRNMMQEFDAPRFIRFSDSLGHSESITKTQQYIRCTETSLRPGDIISLQVEVDASYDPDEYDVTWGVGATILQNATAGTKYILTLEPKHVNERLQITAKLVSKRDWHRHGRHDDKLTVIYRVLPPVR